MGPDHCDRCGADISRLTLDGLCPACLLAGVATPQPDRPGEELTPGETYGAYRIERLIGRGGMGEVYAAEQIGHGRHVALKVLTERLDGPEDRERFLGEGQLAASFCHPNNVYIFGGDEIVATPVIAMELLPGGTLTDRVHGRGPLPPAEAVDAMLEILAGLDAAHRVGILHRDVKPSNCLIDRDGTVRVGDFGVSISMRARQVPPLPTGAGFQGTPHFAAPEQLRGDPVDVRADIYAAGATLYYLLTGQPPLDGRDLGALEARITTHVPRPVQDLQTGIPIGLADVVGRCLAKDPADRPATYADLANQLRRFSSSVTRPAPVGLRLAAGMFDGTLVGGGAFLVSLAAHAGLNWNLAQALPSILIPISVLSWGVSEGVWGASYGKWSCALRVVTAGGGRPGVVRALTRTGISVIPVMLMAIASWSWLISLAVFVGAIGLLSSTARRRNGWAGLHEIASATRVVQRRGPDSCRTSETVTPHPNPGSSPTRRVGPYGVVAPLGTTEHGNLLLACDPRLKRLVWIHELPQRSAAVSARARDLCRPGRLVWLAGQRTARVCWDAYAAMEGGPLITLPTRQSWRAVRQWLLDLARELEAGLEDGSVASVALDHVWVTPDGHIKLLDFRAPGAPAGPSLAVPLTAVSAQRLLSSVAQRALGTPTVPPLPLSASTCLLGLARGKFTTVAEVAATLAVLVSQPDRVTRRQREMALALGVLATAAGAVVVGRFLAPLTGMSFVARNVGALACAFVGVLCAIALRGGFWLRALGIAVVTHDGLEASRWRAAARAAVVWSWAPAQLVVGVPRWTSVGLTIWVLTVVCLSRAGDHPDRGPQDQMTGTYLVPR